VAAWTILAFLPTVRNGFVDWDDGRMFLENPHHRGSWAMRMRGAWTSHLLGEYMPVTWTSYALDRALWDLDAGGYHLTSLGLHVAATLAVYALAWRLLGLARGRRLGRRGRALSAAVAALAFGIHPLRAEPVAWLSARGTVLGGLLLVLGFSLGFWSIITQLTRGRGTPLPVMPTQELLTEGPFRYCRNPMTLGTILAYLGIAVAVGTTAGALLVSALAGSLVTYLKRLEEGELAERFGEAYLAYKREVPFLIPRLAGRR
jgi:protein-S-isoprenylcysteine O-methyltransferase Ste14